VTVSVSCAQWRDGEALDELARRADDAMYAAKRAGRNQVGSA
jgi:PleD family two-component response regulator